MNWGNAALADRRAQLKRAVRTALFPGCSIPVSGSAGPGSSGDAGTSAAAPNWHLRRVPFDVSTSGDNVLISTLTGQKNIYEIFIWTAGGTNDVNLYQGPSATGILLLPVPNFPGQTGLFLGFNGNFDQPHFEIDAGNTLVLNLSAATRVTGLIVYAVPEAS